MESELTKRIKYLARSYKPLLPSKMRTVRWAEEVWTPSGIVDLIRFEDYNAKDSYICPFVTPERFDPKTLQTYRIFSGIQEDFPMGICWRDFSPDMSEKKCHGCVHRKHVYEIGMAVRCYEVKISYSDFRSHNGHNFHGNQNYYVVPKELASRIEAEVPDHIGIITYYSSSKTDGLRMYRESGWQEVREETKTLLLYNAFKKWCDGAVFPTEALPIAN